MKHVLRVGFVAFAFQLAIVSPADATELVPSSRTVPAAHVEAIIRARFAGTGQADRAVRIARCESGLNPRAKNRRSSATGVFQLLSMHWRGRFDPTNVWANVDYAFRLWRRSGWRPWVCR